MKNKLNSHWPLTLLSSLSALINLALPLVLVRVLSTEHMGDYKIFFLYLGLMPWFSMSAGVNNGLYYWATQENTISHFKRSWNLLFVWAFFFSLASAWVVRSYPLGGWFAAGTFLTLIASFHEDALIASGKTWRGGLFAAGFDILRSILVIGVAIGTQSLAGVIGAYLLGLLIKVFFGILFGRKLGFQKFEILALKDTQENKRILTYVLPVSLASVIAVFTHYADQLFLSHVADATYFAGYTLGCLTIPPLNSFEQAVNRILIPSLRKDTPHLFKDAFAELSWILIPATAGLLVFADPIVVMLFTEKYAWTSIFLRLFSFNFLILSFPYDSWARARGDSRWIFKNLLIALGVAAVTIPYLTIRYLGLGALAGLLLTQIALRIGGFLDIRKTTDWKIREFIPITEMAYNTTIVLILSALCFALTPLLGNGLRWFLICAPSFAILYLSITTRRRLISRFRENQKLKVLMMTQYLEMGGLERVIYSLCESYQQSQEVEASVLSYDRREQAASLAKDFEALGVPVFSELKASGFSFKIVLKVIRICHREKIPLLHTHDLGPLLYAAVAKILTLGAIKIVHTQHSFVHLSKKKRHRFYEQLFTRFADALITVSDEVKETYVKLGVPSQKIIVIRNGVLFPARALESVSELESSRAMLIESIVDKNEKSKLEQNSTHSWVLSLARIHPQKGQSQALALWGQLDPSLRKRAKLIFIGQESSEGELSKLKSLASDLGISKEVVWVGMSRTPLRWLQVSQILISLSEFEGMPLSPIEAYGTGLNLVLSKIPGHDIFEGKASWGNLSEVLKQSLDEDFSRSQKRFENANAWRAEYGAMNMAKRYQEVYRKVISS